jgi:hypothetical protein
MIVFVPVMALNCMYTAALCVYVLLHYRELVVLLMLMVVLLLLLLLLLILMMTMMHYQLFKSSFRLLERGYVSYFSNIVNLTLSDACPRCSHSDALKCV